MFRIVSIICIVVLITVLLTDVEGVTFNFKRYPYKKKQKNEKRYKAQMRRCDDDTECSALTGLEQTRCQRQCCSPKCYKELYAWNELEEGEIDVRLPSFKGCVLQNQPLTV